MLVYVVVGIVIQIIPVIGYFIAMAISGPLSFGIAFYILTLSRGGEPKLENLAEGFYNFARAASAYFLKLIFIIGWSLLLIVPGIIAAYSYALTYFILVDEPALGALAAITKSKQMMKGNKWKLVCMNFRFIGWALLCVLTVGLGFLWLIPYMMTSMAKFYDDVKADQLVVAEASAPAPEQNPVVAAA